MSASFSDASFSTNAFSVTAWAFAGVAPVVVDTHDPGIRREPDWEAYRHKQAQLRERLEEVYARATGEDIPAEEILELPKPPKQVRKAITALRAVEMELNIDITRHAEAYSRYMDEEDAVIALLLH